MNAHALKVRNALFETIAETADQVHATNAADVLARSGAIPANLTVAAGLHPQWVRAQMGAAAATAIFAVTNCHDPLALDDFARSERRVTVLRAIAYNEFATPETVDFCNDRIAFEADARPAANPVANFPEAVHLPIEAPVRELRDVPEAERVPAPFARPGSTVLDPDDPLGELPNAVLYLNGPAEAIALLMERARALNNAETILTYVCGYYGPTNDEGRAIRLWNAIAENPLDLLETLPKTRQRSVFSTLFEEREDRGYNAPVNQWDERLIDLMIDAKIPAPTNWSPSDAGEEFLTPGAMAKVIATPRLWPLLYLAPLTPQFVPEIFEKVRGDVRENLIDALTNDCSSEVMAAALFYEGPANIHTELARCGFTTLAYALSGPSDPAVAVAASLVDYDELITYLFDGEDFDRYETKERFAPVDQVPVIAALALAKVDDFDELVEQVRNIIAPSTMTREYAFALMDCVPCAWEALLASDKTRDYVIERIQEVASVDLVMTRLFTQDELAPATLPEILATLA
jgi:hypothetical protein